MSDNIMSRNYQKPARTDLKGRSQVYQTDLPAGIIQPRNIKEPYFLVRVGLAADRPTTPDKYTNFYFATDTGAFSGWNGSAWLSATLS